jgi:hypothetical protein
LSIRKYHKKWIHNGKQKACKDCNRQFVLEPENCISPEDLIDKLLLEKIPLAGIARAVEVSERWLQDYVNEKYDAVKKEIDVTPKKKGKITIQWGAFPFLGSITTRIVYNKGFIIKDFWLAATTLRTSKVRWI